MWRTEELLSCCREVTHPQLVFALATFETVPMDHLALDLEPFQGVHGLVAHVTVLLRASETAHGAGDTDARLELEGFVGPTVGLVISL